MSHRGFAPILIAIIVAVLGIGGYFVYTNYSNRTTVTPIPWTEPDASIAQVERVTPDETANWKTYTSKKLGLTFAYPADTGLSIKEDYISKNTFKSQIGNVMLYFNNSDQILSFTVIQNPQMLSAESWWDSNFTNLYQENRDPINNQSIKREDFSTSSVKLGNLQAFYTENDKLFSSPYYFSNKDTILIISSSLNIQLRDQILSTFQFTQ